MENLTKGKKIYHYKYGSMTIVDVDLNSKCIVVTYDHYYLVDKNGKAILDKKIHYFDFSCMNLLIFETPSEVEEQLINIYKNGGECAFFLLRLNVKKLILFIKNSNCLLKMMKKKKSQKMNP